MPTLWPFFITLWRYRWLLLVGLISGASLGYAWATQQQQMHTARGTYFLNPQVIQTTVWRDLNQQPNAQLLTRLATQPRLLRHVLQQQGVLLPGALDEVAQQHVQAAHNRFMLKTRPGQVVELWVTAPNRAEALGTVGLWAHTINEEIRQQELSRGFAPAGVVLTVIESPQAVPPTRLSTGLGLGGTLGLLGALWLLALREFSRRHRANAYLLEHHLGQRLIGQLPPLGALKAHGGRLQP